MFKANEGRHSVYSFMAHLIFVCKRIGRVFNDERLLALRDILDKVLGDFEAELLDFNGEEDHVHLLVSYPPKRRHRPLTHYQRVLESLGTRLGY